MKTRHTWLLAATALACSYGEVDAPPSSVEPHDPTVQQGEPELWPNQVPVSEILRAWDIDENGHLRETLHYQVADGVIDEAEFKRRLWAGIDKPSLVDKQSSGPDCTTLHSQYPCDIGVGSTASEAGFSLCLIPDNRYVTYCALNSPFAGNLTNAGFNEGLEFNLAWKLSHNTLDGYDFNWRSPEWANPGNCPGFHAPFTGTCCDVTGGNCSSGTHDYCADNGLPPNDPTHTDMVFIDADLPPGTCGMSGSSSSGYLGCTRAIVQPTTYSWNNGCTGSHPYMVVAGSAIEIDTVRIENHAAANRDGLSLAQATEFMYSHVMCHEMGHALGLKHYDAGSGQSPSCMSKEWPSALNTKQYWNQTERCDVEGNCTLFGPTPSIPTHRPPHQTREW